MAAGPFQYFLCHSCTQSEVRGRRLKKGRTWKRRRRRRRKSAADEGKKGEREKKRQEIR